MSDLGILDPDQRTELLEGEVVLMAAKNPSHVVVTKRITDLCSELLKNKALIRSQDPTRLSSYSEPEPDVVVVKGTRPDDYIYGHPASSDVFLLIEVADATLSQDLGKKAKMYARANIPEYWVVDVNSQRVFVHRYPTADRYPTISVLTVEDMIAPLAFPDTSIAIQAFFPSNSIAESSD
jgi:Uma2 family endonuclease